MNAFAGGERTFRERLGGRWAISIQGYAIAAVIILVGVASHVGTLSSGDRAIFLTATFAVFAVNALLEGLLHRTRWSQRRIHPVPAEEVFVRLIITGLCFSVAYALVQSVLEVDTPAGIAEGFVLYPAVSLWVGSSLVVYLDVIDQARHLRDAAIRERSQSEEMRERADNAARQLTQRVNSILAPEIVRLKSVVTDQAHADIPEEIRGVVDRSVRGVSHQIWESAAHDSGRIRLLEVLRATLLYPVLRPWPMIGLAIVIPVFQAGETTNPAVLSLSAVAAAVVYGECTLANAAMRRWPSWRLLVIGAVVVVFSGQTLLVDQLGEDWGQSSDDPGWLTLLVLTVCLITVTSALGSYRDLNDQRAQMIAREIAADRLDAAARTHALSEEARRLAALLHGRLQSRLLGCAMALEFAKDDPFALSEALARTAEVLEEEWNESEPSFHDAFDVLTKTWVGLALVNVRLDESAQTTLTIDAVRVTEELVSNAVRHGGATHVDVDVRQVESDLVVTVHDDGVGGTGTHSGLGSQLLAHVGKIERSSKPNGWVVKVSIPLRTT